MTRRLRAFKRWMRSHGIEFSDTMQLRDSPLEGISVHALCELREGDLVATIPKSACLTIKTSGARDAIEEAGLTGFLGLAFALMYERSLGEGSSWAGYLQLLPERECVPLVWSLAEVDALLAGTELHKIVKQDKSFLHEDWKESIKPLIQFLPLKFDADSFGVEQYFSAKSLISSRSFEIDSYHGSGMVPLADLFNHKTGAENVHFTSISCPTSSDDESVDDIGDASDDDKSSLVNSTASSSGEDSTALEMIIVRDAEAGSEVFNTYGSMGNAALLHRYGFTELDNPFDIVNIDLDVVVKWCSSSFSNRYARARLSFWRRLNYSGCTSQSSEYFEISYDGEPQLELLVLLYIIFLAEDAYGELKCMVDSFEGTNESTDVVKLIQMSRSKCTNISQNIKCHETPDNILELLLTEHVCCALISIADFRESFYGSCSLEEDMDRLRTCCRVKERKMYHSLVLRVSERKILARLRAYASGSSKTKKRKR